jgi:hypothetical protein
VLVLDAGHALASGTTDEVIHSLTGTITVTDQPGDRRRAWRRGRVYHEWHPDRASGAEHAVAVDLEDVVIAEMLRRREQPKSAPA